MRQEKNKFFFTSIIVFGFVIFIWMFFQYLKSNYDDYLLETHIQNFEMRNIDLSNEINDQKNDFAYFASETYLEKYGKSSLGLKMPGEKVVILEETNPIEDLRYYDEEAYQEYEIRSLPNPEKWWIYFFGDQKIVQKYKR